MKKILFKSSLGFAFVAITSVSLSSCTTSVNFFGHYAPVTSNYKDSLVTQSETSTDGSASTVADSTTETGKSLGYEYAFSGYEFNNFGYSSSSSMISTSDNSTVFAAASYAGEVWRDIIYPSMAYVTSLGNLYIMGYKTGDISNLTSHPVITTNNSATATAAKNDTTNTNDALINQFVYSWANASSVGKSTTNNSDSIRFGISGVQFKFATINNGSSTGGSGTASQDTNSTTNNQITTGFFPRKDSKLKVDKDKNTATFDSTVNFQIQFKLGYWDPTDSKPTSGFYSNVDDIKNKVKQSSVYDYSNYITNANLYLTLNYTFKTTLTYTYSTLKSKDSSIENITSTAAEDSSSTTTPTEITWTDKLTNAALIPAITFTATANSSSSAGVNELTGTTMGTYASEIATLIDSSANDQSKIVAEKDKLKNSLLLSTSSILTN